VIVELRGRLPADGGAVAGPLTDIDQEAVEALRALGYTAAEARSAVVRVKPTPGMTVEERVVGALRELSEV
jgi:Holliday junction DNA helicase RuvA